MYPYGYYLCFSSPTLILPSAELEKLKARIDWEGDLDEPDENFVAHVNTATRDLCEGLEIGYPEKLTNMRAEWSVSVLIRSGRFDRNRPVLTDEEIIALAQAIDGGSPIYLGKISSPRFGRAGNNSAWTWNRCCAATRAGREPYLDSSTK